MPWLGPNNINTPEIWIDRHGLKILPLFSLLLTSLIFSTKYLQFLDIYLSNWVMNSIDIPFRLLIQSDASSQRFFWDTSYHVTFPWGSLGFPVPCHCSKGSLGIVCHRSTCLWHNFCKNLTCFCVLTRPCYDRVPLLVPRHEVLQGGGEHAGVQLVLPHHPGGKTGETRVSYRIGDLM